MKREAVAGPRLFPPSFSTISIFSMTIEDLDISLVVY